MTRPARFDWPCAEPSQRLPRLSGRLGGLEELVERHSHPG